MIQLLLRNRYLFISCLGMIWILIFLTPQLGSYLRKSKVNKGKGDKPVTVVNNFMHKPSVDIPYAYAGSFFQDNLCLDSLDAKVGKAIALWACHDAGKNQFWFLMKDGLLKNRDNCLEGPEDLKTHGKQVFMQKCDDEKEHQSWRYDMEQISMSGSELCLEAKPKEKVVFLSQCNPDLAAQKWKLKVPPGLYTARNVDIIKAKWTHTESLNKLHTDYLDLKYE